MTTKPFIINTTNFIARKISCVALKKIDTSPDVHRLYIKAAIKSPEIVIGTVEELKIWIRALEAYQPMNATEWKVYPALLSCAKAGLVNRTPDPTDAPEISVQVTANTKPVIATPQEVPSSEPTPVEQITYDDAEDAPTKEQVEEMQAFFDSVTDKEIEAIEKQYKAMELINTAENLKDEADAAARVAENAWKEAEKLWAEINS
jgi:DNA-binding MarR family transcriptional regulator